MLVKLDSVFDLFRACLLCVDVDTGTMARVHLGLPVSNPRLLMGWIFFSLFLADFTQSAELSCSLG